MFAIGLALLLAADAPASDSVDATVRAAIEQVRAGQNAVALAALDPLADEINQKVAHSDTRYFCAYDTTAMLIGLALGAKDKVTTVALRSTDCDVLFLRGYVLENLNRLPEALAQLRVLLTLAPDNPHFQVEYAAAQRQSGDLSGALASYRHAIELAARDKRHAFDQAAALRGVGYILTEDNDLDGAEEAYRQSLALAPGHPVALNELNYIARLRAKGTKTKGQTLESNVDPAKAKMPIETHP